jgi:transposase
MAKQQQRRYPAEVKARAVELATTSGESLRKVSRDVGVHYETLRMWVRQSQADAGRRHDLPSTAEREEVKRLRREIVELRRANEILKAATAFFAKEADHTRAR